MTPERPALTGSVLLDGDRAVVTVAGEVDVATAGLLRGWLDEAITSAAVHVTVSMEEVTFLDGQCVSVLVDAAGQLGSRGGRLRVSGLAAPGFDVFSALGLQEQLRVQRPQSSSALERGLVRAAAIPRTREVLDASLRLVTSMAQSVVMGADGVSITLPRGGRLGTVAASNDVVLEMDHDQYDTGQGPCLDAATQGERFFIDSLAQEDRWPAFVPRARARGIESILSTPLVAAGRPVGALNIYSRTQGAFERHEHQWADQFAAEAASVVATATAAGSDRALNAQVRQALESRQVIALAQGVVMQRDGVTAEGAYAVLRETSRRTSAALRDVCEELLAASGPDQRGD